MASSTIEIAPHVQPLLREYLKMIMQPLSKADPEVMPSYVFAILKRQKSIEEIRGFAMDQMKSFLESKTEMFVARLFELIRYRFDPDNMARGLQALIDYHKANENSDPAGKFLNGSYKQIAGWSDIAASAEDNAPVSRPPLPYMPPMVFAPVEAAAAVPTTRSSSSSSSYGNRTRYGPSRSRSRSPKRRERSPDRSRRRDRDSDRDSSPSSKRRRTSDSYGDSRDYHSRDRSDRGDRNDRGDRDRDRGDRADRDRDSYRSDKNDSGRDGRDRGRDHKESRDNRDRDRHDRSSRRDSESWQASNPANSYAVPTTPYTMAPPPMVDPSDPNYAAAAAAAMAYGSQMANYYGSFPGASSGDSSMGMMYPGGTMPPQSEYGGDRDSRLGEGRYGSSERGRGRGRGRGGRGGRGGMGRGGFGGGNDEVEDRHQRREKERDPTGTTLDLGNVPDEINTVEAIWKHFSKFGAIKNIVTVPELQRAHIKFATPAEASAAIRSTEAVMNNRFVKLYYGAADIGLAKPGSAVMEKFGYKILGKEATQFVAPEIQQKQQEIAQQKEELKQKLQERLRGQRELLQKLEKLSKKEDLSPEAKETARKDMKTILDAMNATLTTLKTLSTPTAPAAGLRSPGFGRGRGAVGMSMNDSVESTDGSTEHLEQKLAELHKERVARGIPMPTRGRGGFRGRAGAFAGMGRGAGRFNLDLRPTTFRVSAVPEEWQDESKLRGFFESYGGVKYVSIDGSDVTVQLDNRRNAEAALTAAATLAGSDTRLPTFWTNNPDTSAVDEQQLQLHQQELAALDAAHNAELAQKVALDDIELQSGASGGSNDIEVEPYYEDEGGEAV